MADRKVAKKVSKPRTASVRRRPGVSVEAWLDGDFLYVSLPNSCFGYAFPKNVAESMGLRRKKDGQFKGRLSWSASR